MSPSGFLGLSLTVLVLQTGCHAHWDNDWDDPLDFKCYSDSYAITRIQSIHSNHYEDRLFEIGCTQVDTSSRKKSCYWTNFVNSFDSRVSFTCKSNHFINGMRSNHRDYEEDRIWKFRCCAIAERPLQDCTLTGWTNTWDNRQDYTVPSGHVIKGVLSIHSNYYEDRLFEYLVCKFGKSEDGKATSLLDYLRPEPRATESEDESESDSHEEESREATLLYYLMQVSTEDSQKESMKIF